MLLLLCGLATDGRGGTFSDDFNRPDSENSALGEEWKPRGDAVIVDQTLEIRSGVEGGQSSVEVLANAEETAQGDGRSFELTVDFQMPPLDSDARVGLIFNWQTPAEHNVFYYSKSHLQFIAVRGGEGSFNQEQSLPMELVPGAWYRLKVRSTDDKTVECSLSTTGADAEVLETISVLLPEPVLAGGSGGLMASLVPVRLDNFTLTTAP